MQQVSPAVIQNRYPPVYYQYPTVAMESPQSAKSIDPNIFGPSAPPVKNSKSINNNINNHNHNQLHDIDLRRLILFNLPIDLIQEYLELYLEYLSGETEIERIDYSNLEDTTVMVTFKTDLDMTEVRRRHGTRTKLNDSEISLAEVTSPTTVMIRNLPADISRDVIELYFSNRRRSDGGLVADVSLDHEHQHALVTFADHKDVCRIVKREHLIHGQRLDVRIFYAHMGIEPFIDASNVGKKPAPIFYRALDDIRYAFLLKNRPLLDELREQLKPLNGHISLQTEGAIEISFTESRLTVKLRLKWTKDIEKLVEQFLNERLVVHKVPWNNNKIPSITSEQLADLSLKDNTRLMQLAPLNSQQDHIIVTALKDDLDRALSELTDMLTARTASANHIPLNDAVYRSKPVNATRDPKVNNHRSSLLIRSSSPSKQSPNNVELAPPPALSQPSMATIDDSLENLRLYQMDLLSKRFIDLSRRTYTNLNIDIDRTGRRIIFRGPLDQVNVCKNYFESILNGITHKHYKLGKEMAVFLSNPDTVEIVVENLARADHVCAYEIERVTDHHRRSSTSPVSSSNNRGSPTTSSHHKLVIYGLSRENCDRAHDFLRHDIRVSSIMLDKDDKRCLASDSWHAYVRDLYSNPGGFRRRRVLLQVKQNQLTLVGFDQDVDSMRKQIYNYFVENAISFYESD
ncbi:unnamed protein product [Rotaria magnacalcarata]|uniref:RRM domain-containing protein n=2 Tax=Rotaria magnacalcarata TaxID=392030 RepID=A0A816SXB9_9BILA|nr:unnamed protein product [Rotaria magnacalcarata]CAF1646389.1 unnamed protein product [Rotaria magnacalcarata]CAF2066660.1 unnamed protein product [Rotaria magnacalcarata]CAF2093973.1 unnamed protein product [Rotaria magnacalcarata]CAF2132165.1 unnamed protein product [Rotaria magnacalcarata]